jgi:hypothetical protein
MLGGVNAQRFLEDPECRVPGDVQGEQPRRPDGAVMAQPDQGGGQRQVEDQLI